MKKLHRQRLEGLAEGLQLIDDATRRAVIVSEECMGVVHTGRQNRALFILAKVISHNMSLISLVQKAVEAPKGASLLDHFSVVALGRVSIDTSIMGLYLSEPTLTADEWNLRRHILFLHDATNRKRFLSALAKAEDADTGEHLTDYPEAKAALGEAIEKHGLASGLPLEQIQDLKDGRVFVGGVRGAVREAGLSVELFEAHNAYFSPFVHGHPVSFLRANEHNISFNEPSEYQKYLCSYVMQAVAVYTAALVDRMQDFCGDMANDPLGQID